MKIAIGLTFPGDLKDESVLCFVCKNFDVNVNIIEASFSTASGWAFLEVEGKKEDIEKVIDYMEGKGIKIQKIQTTK
ncbi:MAG: NIL domain-containing protein [Candidatus Omnitrophota bacterium]